MNVYEKVLKVRIGFLKANVKKSGENKYAQYSYFDLQDIIPTIETLCDEYGVFPLVSHGAEQSTLKLINIEKPDEFIEVTSPTSTAKLKGAHDVQNLGAVQTYLRRYLYMTAFDIVEHDALDKTQGKTEKAGQQNRNIPPEEPTFITQEQLDKIFDYSKRLSEAQARPVKEIFDEIEKGYKCKLKELTPKQGVKVFNQLAAMLTRATGQTA